VICHHNQQQFPQRSPLNGHGLDLSLDLLANILYGLRAYLLPERFTIPQLGKMSLKFGAIEMLFEHPIVALMERYTVVVDHPSDIDDALEIPIPLMVV
jgi:hypothetical protein